MCNPIILGTATFGGCGGSALTNILEEFVSISSIASGGEFECKFFSENILPLEIALKSGYGLDYAIKSFLFNAKNCASDPNYLSTFGEKFYEHALEYIGSFSKRYLGAVYKNYDYEFIDYDEYRTFKNAKRLYDYKYGKRVYDAYEPYYWKPAYTPFGFVYYSDFKDDFYDKTHDYIDKVFSPVYSVDRRYVLVDELYTTEGVLHELKYFKDSKALIANRDPRDLYVINKEIYGEWYIPSWDVDAWIKYYKASRQCIAIQKKIDTDNILHIQFESLIYDYEESLSNIKKFLGLVDSDHVNKGKIFIPEKSKKNTQVFRQYPQYRKDIEKIEKELYEFCYPYREQDIRRFSATEIKAEERETLEYIRKVSCVFQKTGRLPFSNTKGAVIFTVLFESFMTFRERKNIYGYFKWFVKIMIGLVIFPINFIYEFFMIKKYQHKNKKIDVVFL